MKVDLNWVGFEIIWTKSAFRSKSTNTWAYQTFIKSFDMFLTGRLDKICPVGDRNCRFRFAPGFWLNSATRSRSSAGDLAPPAANGAIIRYVDSKVKYKLISQRLREIKQLTALISSSFKVNFCDFLETRLKFHQFFFIKKT